MVNVALIGNEQIRSLDLSPGELLRSMADAVERLRRGDASLIPKMALHPRAGGEFYAMLASLGDLAVVKWLNLAGSSEPGAPLIRALLLATHIPSGRTLALMEAEWITALRTAAVSAFAARGLAPARAGSLGVIGCGLQAGTHFDAWRASLGLREVVAHSRRRASAEAFGARVRAGGVAARVVDSPLEVVAASGVLLIASPPNTPTPGYLDSRDVKPGTLVIALDLGVAMQQKTLSSFDRIVVDHRDQTEALMTAGMMPRLPRIDQDLSTLTAMRADERVLFVPPGMALADAMVAELVLQRLGLWPR